MKRDRTHDAPRSGARIPNSLLALGSAAVLAVYSAGNLRTREAAQRFDDESGLRRRPMSPGDAGGAVGSAVGSAAGGDRIGDRAAEGVSATEQGLPRADSGATPGGVATASAAERAPAPVTSPTTETVANAASATMTAQKAPPANAATSAANTVSTAPTSTASSMTASSTSAVSQSVAAATTNGTALPPSPAPKTAAIPPANSVATTSDSTKPATDSVKTTWRDGTYSGWGTSRHGDIEATVVIEGGKITGASISRCLTRYSCSWIAHLQQQVVTRQSPDVDYVSGATQSANAFYYAVFDALQKAK